MAPPLKRRKLSSSLVEPEFPLDNSTGPSHSHSVTSLQHTYSSQAPARTDFPQDDEPEQRIQQAEVGGIADFQVLVPRQGTGSSSSVVSTALDVLTANIDDSISSMTSSISLSFSVSAPSPTLPADTVPAGVTPSESSSSRSDHPSPSSYASNTVSSSTINETSTLTSSASRSTSTGPSTESASSYNLTTSAIILEDSSSTTTLKTTITLDNSTSTTSSIDAAFLFTITLDNGEVTTLSRHSGAYTTTLKDGEVLTIPSISASTTRERTSTSSRTSTASRTSFTSSSSSEQSTITPTLEATGVVGQGQPTATYSSTTSTTSAASGGGGGKDNPPAGTIAGGVVGGAAGLAVLVLIAMLFVRWYRRKSQVGHRELPAGSGASPDASEQPTDRSGPGMAERAGLMPFAAALPALFRHQNRSAEGSAPSERGFTRVSGRKLPSAFSGGMSSEGARSQQQQPPPQGMPLSGSPPDERNLSSTSFYRDSSGFYGGDGSGSGGAGRSSASPTSPTSPTSPSSSAPIHTGPEMMTMSPGPQRQPQVHSGGPYTLTPETGDYPQSPPAAAAQFARSDTPSSLRNSRFTEDM